MGALITCKMGALIRAGALTGIEALIDKNTFDGGGGTYSEGALIGRGGAKSNHYGISNYFYVVTFYIPSLRDQWLVVYD